MAGIDLHLHSNASDGEDTPTVVMEFAAEAGLSAVALTDHDTVRGCAEALKRAEELGLAFAPGVEMTAYVGKIELHILGLFVDPESSALLGLFEELVSARVERSKVIAGKLQALGVMITAEDIDRQCEGVPGRPHVARAILEKGYVETIQEAFDKYIADNGPANVPKRQLSPGEAIGAIRAAGGIAALAHPGISPHDELIPDLVEEGMEAIEVYHTRHSPAQAEHYGRLARKHDLLETGGSDYHGLMKEDVPLGGPKIDMEVFEKLAERAAAKASS